MESRSVVRSQIRASSGGGVGAGSETEGEYPTIAGMRYKEGTENACGSRRLGDPVQ